MKTYRITEQDIARMTPTAVGYKMFRNDWTAKQRGYDYKDDNGNVVGTIHKADGDIAECKWGLHFSENPHDCFNFYEPLCWNKFAKVEAYGNVIKSDDGKKSVAQVIKIVNTYTFNEFVDLIRYTLQSDGVNLSDGVNESYGVNLSDGVNLSYGVNKSNGVNESYGVNKSNGVNESYGVNLSYGVNESYGVNLSYGVNKSNGVNESYGVNESDGVNLSYGVVRCDGISRSIFCINKSGKLMIFNKKVTEERFNEVWVKLSQYGWYPKFNNAEELKGNLKWYEAYIPGIVCVPNEVAWSYMPAEMKEYIQNIPEYSDRLFKKITGKIKEG